LKLKRLAITIISPPFFSLQEIIISLSDCQSNACILFNYIPEYHSLSSGPGEHLWQDLDCKFQVKEISIENNINKSSKRKKRDNKKLIRREV
jgi:hypothetical protein